MYHPRDLAQKKRARETITKNTQIEIKMTDIDYWNNRKQCYYKTEEILG
jgi:hypothetical protein